MPCAGRFCTQATQTANMRRKRTYVPSGGDAKICGAMRPVGSTNGRIPPGGHPAIDDELGGFLAGFIEGEACFSIRRQRGYGYACNMGLTARADDAVLIRNLASALRLGTVNSVEARRTSKPQVRWTVAAKSDCRRLVEILDRHPLRGRKSQDLAIWRAAVRYWVGPDATARHAPEDWPPMAYLASRLREVRRYKVPCELSLHDGTTGLDLDWGSFLAGFITAEGCFMIGRTGSPGRYAPRFAINVRADDESLLTALRARTGVGGVGLTLNNSEGSAPAAHWVTTGSKSLTTLVDILDRFPPRGRKWREYEIWRAAVAEYAEVRTGQDRRVTPAQRERVHRRVGELREELLRAREYEAS